MADVLEVLHRLDLALLSRRATAHECGELHDAIDRVAELVAAETERRELQQWLRDNPGCPSDPKMYHEHIEAWIAAEARSAAALAAMKG